MVQLHIANGEGVFDITSLVTTITLSGDYQQCARTLEFGLASSATDGYLPRVSCELGNSVVLLDEGRTLFDGFVITRQKGSSASAINVTCFDRGFYMRRNLASYKFKNQTADAVARRICKDFGIDIGELAAPGEKFSRNFLGSSLYDIVMTAYNLAGGEKKYIARFEGVKFCVREKRAGGDTLVIENGSNLLTVSCTESIQNMVNKVLIYNEKDAVVKTLTKDEQIRQFGVLQSIVKQTDDKKEAEKEAQKLLDENGIDQKVSITNLGDTSLITGGTVVVHEGFTGLYGLFYIDSDTHIWKNGTYTNRLVLNFRNIMDEKEVGELPDKK